MFYQASIQTELVAQTAESFSALGGRSFDRRSDPDPGPRELQKTHCAMEQCVRLGVRSAAVSVEDAGGGCSLK